MRDIIQDWLSICNNFLKKILNFLKKFFFLYIEGIFFILMFLSICMLIFGSGSKISKLLARWREKVCSGKTDHDLENEKALNTCDHPIDSTISKMKSLVILGPERQATGRGLLL